MANEQTIRAGTFIVNNTTVTIVASMNITAISVNMVTENGVATLQAKVAIPGLGLNATALPLQQNFPINIPANGSGYIDGVTITADAATSVHLICFQ